MNTWTGRDGMIYQDNRPPEPPEISAANLVKLRNLIDSFAERSRSARGVNNDLAAAWAEAAADLAVALTINERDV
jgi:hypothetical protein